MSDGGLFDLFIRGTSNGGGLNVGKQTLPICFPPEHRNPNTDLFYFLRFSFQNPDLVCLLKKRVFLASTPTFTAMDKFVGVIGTDSLFLMKKISIVFTFNPLSHFQNIKSI